MTPGPTEILDVIRACIVKVDPGLGAMKLEPETNFARIGVPSIVLITVVFEIEEHFDIVIVDAGLDDFETIGELRDIVQALVGNKVGA